ncbi:hypothetical protein DIPPA_27940 [Diplonema papillatum]|nr:hypothetical protein DIPPA_27940 [Diplonema papillatum]
MARFGAVWAGAGLLAAVLVLALAGGAGAVEAGAGARGGDASKVGLQVVRSMVNSSVVSRAGRPENVANYFMQSTCPNSTCSGDCVMEAYAFNVCQQMSGGGSFIAFSCDNECGVTMAAYLGSSNCLGSFSIGQQPVNVCHAEAAGYFLNSCVDSKRQANSSNQT